MRRKPNNYLHKSILGIGMNVEGSDMGKSLLFLKNIKVISVAGEK